MFVQVAGLARFPAILKAMRTISQDSSNPRYRLTPLSAVENPDGAVIGYLVVDTETWTVVNTDRVLSIEDAEVLIGTLPGPSSVTVEE
jgi:hypothetical protein